MHNRNSLVKVGGGRTASVVRKVIRRAANVNSPEGELVLSIITQLSDDLCARKDGPDFNSAKMFYDDVVVGNESRSILSVYCDLIDLDINYLLGVLGRVVSLNRGNFFFDLDPS